MPIAHVNDTTIYYEDRGAGRPLVFVHGLGATHAMWEPQVQSFRHLNRVITLDTRGSGQSGRLVGWNSILHRQAADLAALLDQLDIEQVVLCGVSYGGVFAQRFALDYPDRCTALIVADSFSDTHIRSLKMLGVMVANYQFAPAYLLPGRWLVPVIRKQYAPWPLAQQHLEGIVRRMRGYETMKVRLAINGIDYTPSLHRIKCPTMGIVGDRSPIAVQLMQTLVDAIPDARLKVVTDSFDPTNLCQPNLFNQLLARFLKEVR